MYQYDANKTIVTFYNNEKLKFVNILETPDPIVIFFQIQIREETRS